MKNTFKYLAAGVSMVCAVSALADETAYEGQPIGSIEVTSSTTNTIVAVAFKELSAANESVSVSNILSTVNLVAGDKVFVISGSNYQCWTLDANGFWQASDQTYTIGASGNSTSGVGSSAASQRPAIGEGFWLQRVGTRTGSLPSNFYIFGAAVQTSSTVATGGVKSLLGNPKNAAATLTTTNANVGDTINLVASNGALMKEYKYVTLSGVDAWAVLKAGSFIPQYEAATVTIPAGQGFWYNSTGSSDVTLNWN